jgi:hypothetical protein
VLVCLTVAAVVPAALERAELGGISCTVTLRFHRIAGTRSGKANSRQSTSPFCNDTVTGEQQPRNLRDH